MPRINLRMPPNIAAGFVCAPEFNTLISPRTNGVEDRNREWLYGRFKAEGTYNAFGADEQELLDEIFQAAAGMWAAWRFQDRTHTSRYIVADQVLSPEIGTDEPLQVQRTYTWGLTTPRMIQAIDADYFVLKRNGTPITSFTLDDELGLLVPDTTWDTGTYTWSGRHDIWMRFNSDWGAFRRTTEELMTADIELIEDRQRPEA